MIYGYTISLIPRPNVRPGNVANHVYAGTPSRFNLASLVNTQLYALAPQLQVMKAGAREPGNV